MRIGIIGAGAAGCFCAVTLKRLIPEAKISVWEKKRRPMAKLAITGGGRCNLTNTFQQITNLQQAYPRGARLMQRMLQRFSPEATFRWWEKEGVRLVAQQDECVFPQSQDAMEIVNTLLRLMRQNCIHIFTETPVSCVTPQNGVFRISTPRGDSEVDYLVVATGGSPRMTGLSFLAPLEPDIVSPVPSLFALNTGDDGLHSLTGTVVEDCHVAIAGSKFKASGALLITHFGMSGPAILRLSSYAARYMAEQNYNVMLTINWMHGMNEEEIHLMLQSFRQGGKQVANHHPLHLTARHWAYLLQRSHISPSLRWDAMNKKEINRLATILTADTYPVTGRCAYKGEFVTCGGISLRSIDPATLSLRHHPRVYLAGEVLDVDAITGGFNLQAAWSMGYSVAHSIASSHLSAT